MAFNYSEISKASTKLKDGKATEDGVHAEFIKHSSSNAHAQIADLLNKISETGEYPDHIQHGILIPLPKPPKKNERVNVRPLSALLFIVYLASSIKPLPPQIQQVDCNRPLWSALDWFVDKDKHKVEVDPKYADDITFVRTDESKINQIERLMPEMLKENNLYVNPTKTEKYTISRTSNGSWKKKCKLLGSLLDSDKDIKRRKGLAIDSFKTLENVFKSRHISEVIRLRIFKAYVESIFLYNSEIWTLTKSLEDKIDSFQRRLLRKVIRVNWPRLISNEDLYNRTHMKPWSVIIMKR